MSLAIRKCARRDIFGWPVLRSAPRRGHRCSHFFWSAAFQGLLINVTSARVFRRISPWIQMAGMSVMILALMMFPVYAMLLPFAAHTHAAWLWLFPPVWFTGLYDLLLQPSDPLFASLGRFAGVALCLATAAFCATWGLGFRRHYRRTLEAEDTGLHPPRAQIFDKLPASIEERAIFRFSGKILQRSAAHRLFLASYWSVGIAIGLLAALAIGTGGHLALSRDGLRAFPLLVVFFVLSGFRAAFQFPPNLHPTGCFGLPRSAGRRKAAARHGNACWPAGWCRHSSYFFLWKSVFGARGRASFT